MTTTRTLTARDCDVDCLCGDCIAERAAKRRPAALCACRNLPDHEALCPANPDPFVCDCGNVFDPALDGTGTYMSCGAPHCADCRDTCRECTRSPMSIVCMA